MDVGHVGRDVLHSRENIGLLALQLVHPRLHRRLIHAVLNGGHHAGDAALDLLQRLGIKFRLRSTLAVLLIERLGVGAHGLGHRVGGNELPGQARQNTGFDLVPKDRAAVVAGPAAIAIEAAVAVAGDDAVVTATATAFEQTREQKRRAAQYVHVPGTIGTHALGDILELFGDFLLPPSRRPP